MKDMDGFAMVFGTMVLIVLAAAMHAGDDHNAERQHAATVAALRDSLSACQLREDDLGYFPLDNAAILAAAAQAAEEAWARQESLAWRRIVAQMRRRTTTL